MPMLNVRAPCRGILRPSHGEYVAFTHQRFPDLLCLRTKKLCLYVVITCSVANRLDDGTEKVSTDLAGLFHGRPSSSEVSRREGG